jgi:ubiquinone/menaquinone biosynthesis C-methylase UbiE
VHDNLLRKITRYILAVPILVVSWVVLVRIIRYFIKFPMPQVMAPVIDNPLRRRFQPPDEIAWQSGIQPGMRVLEVGPGSGAYTLSAALRAGDAGQVVAVDIEPRIVRRLKDRLREECVSNAAGLVADVHALPFDTGTFNAVYMVTVIGEIPEPVEAMREFRRALAPDGTLAFSEFLPDPDYPTQRSLRRKAARAGFKPCYRAGSWFAYTLVFELGG